MDNTDWALIVSWVAAGVAVISLSITVWRGTRWFDRKQRSWRLEDAALSKLEQDLTQCHYYMTTSTAAVAAGNLSAIRDDWSWMRPRIKTRKIRRTGDRMMALLPALQSGSDEGFLQAERTLNTLLGQLRRKLRIG